MGPSSPSLDLGLGILDFGFRSRAPGHLDPGLRSRTPPIQNPNAQTRGPAPRFAPPPEIQNRPRRPAPLLIAAIILAPVAWSLCQIQARGDDAGVAHGKELYAQNKF